MKKDIEKFEEKLHKLEMEFEKFGRVREYIELREELIKMYEESIKLKDFYKEKYDDLYDRL